MVSSYLYPNTPSIDRYSVPQSHGYPFSWIYPIFRWIYPCIIPWSSMSFHQSIIFPYSWENTLSFRWICHILKWILLVIILSSLFVKYYPFIFRKIHLSLCESSFSKSSFCSRRHTQAFITFHKKKIIIRYNWKEMIYCKDYYEGLK